MLFQFFPNLADHPCILTLLPIVSQTEVRTRPKDCSLYNDRQSFLRHMALLEVTARIGSFWFSV